MSLLSLDQIAALQTLRNAYPVGKIALIGAAALGFHVPMIWRKTADVDLVVAMSIAEVEMLMSRLSGWTRDPKKEQRWYAPKKVSIDLVPAPDEALEKGKLVWPSGYEMNLAGLRLALMAPLRDVAPGLSIALPSVPVIVLLKMAAYVDGAGGREKDLEDLAHIFNSYPPAGDERLFTDEVFLLSLDARQSPAFTLGRELRELVEERDGKVVGEFLEKVARVESWGRFVSLTPWRYQDDPEEELQIRLEAFRAGFSAPRSPDAF